MGRTPVLVTRDAKGNIGAFINACRHKGATVARLSEGISSRGTIYIAGKGTRRLFGEAGFGNAMNPRIGCGMQQARNSRSGGSRRGGEKPRGRNGTARVEPSSPK